MQIFRPLFNYLFVLSMFLFGNVVSAATINVKTDRSPVVINESFQMIFEADGSVDRDPDFSPLDKDFKVLSTSVSSNMSIINGTVSRTKQWQLTVLARREGKLTIPSIAFGQDRSNAASITVTRTAAGPGTTQRGDANIFLEVKADNLQPYVQSQVIYTIKLYRAVNTANASLSDPEITGGDAIIERLGEDQSYETWVQSKRYLVVERNYAIYPQVSDKLTIAPIRFQGQIARDRFSMFDPFGSPGKTVIRQSEPVTLDVKAIPAAFAGGHWLPSRNVSLIEQWSENPTELQAGEPITRTLVLTAEGQTGSQLPELPFWSLPGFKQYPDQPSLNDDKNRTGITGTRQEKIAIIPNVSGTYTLPEIKLPWWNTETNTLEYAQLPARQITVLGAAGSTQDLLDLTPAPVANVDGRVVPDSQDTTGEQQLAGQDNISQPSTNPIWQYISFGLALGWFITLVLWRRSHKRNSEQEKEDHAVVAIKQVIKRIKQACHDSDVAQTKELLLQWAAVNWLQRPPMSIGEIGKRGSDALAHEIRLLSDSLYSSNKQSWDGKRFWEVFDQEKESFNRKKEEAVGNLEPLYKI